MSTKKCSSCGLELDSSEEVCKYCGKKQKQPLTDLQIIGLILLGIFLFATAYGMIASRSIGKGLIIGFAAVISIGVIFLCGCLGFNQVVRTGDFNPL